MMLLMFYKQLMAALTILYMTPVVYDSL